ncbi:MAG: hypothetical protein K0Q77_2576 [Anaerosporomusa subterranea]|jgi:uncharacterized protein YlxW (UPF0749 family)|nr:hypothetical protein [Anaerosporomusa subterranea]
MKLRKGQVALTLVCIILGLMLAIQFRTTDGNLPLQSQRAEDLTRRLAQVDQERTTLQNEVHKLRSGVTSSADAEQIKSKAGFTRITGTGIQVTMDDRGVKSGPGKNSELYLIRDSDILLVLNELKAAGAEAISINGQRVISTTEVRNAGPAIVVNNIAISSPIEIKAIGDPAMLENALKIRGGVIETRQIWGIQIAVTKQQNVEIPMYKGPQRFNYAKPVKEGTL